MTSAAVRRPRPSVLRAEWIKILGSRGTLVAFGLLATLPVAFSALIVANTPSTDPPGVPGDDDIVANTLVGVLAGVVVAAVIGATSIGNEERSGMISTTYTATPRRPRVILAKASVAVAITLVIGVVSSWVSYLVARPLQRDQGYVAPSYPEPDLLSATPIRAIVGTGLLTAAVALYAVGIATVVRRTSIAIPLVVATLLLPGLLATSDRIQEFVGRWTPFAGFSVQHTVQRPDYHAGPWHGLGVTVAYAVLAVAVGLVLARRRDTAH
ncbi:ABC transporter permease [Parafrankia sp. FMc2]|uniref:ABC transporter permease n=1 Tax=Parafrankia sp. FMc2 TaxID=3233196 RepID=UPI0034D77907